MIKGIEKLERNGSLDPAELIRIRYAGNDTRFNLVTVGDTVIDTVTDSYDLVNNRAQVEAIGRAADICGLPDLIVRDGFLNRSNGNSYFRFRLDDGGWMVPGDPSKNFTELHAWNNYAGRGRYGVGGGEEREICTNGMRAFVITEEIAKIHKGEEEIDEWALEAVSIFAGKMHVMRTLAEVAAASDWSPTRSGDALIKRAAPRYRDKLAEAVKRYTHEVGFNGWAAINAVTEIATHEMGDTVTAKKWSDAAIESVLADIGQT